MRPSCRRCASRPRRTLAAEGAARRAAAGSKHRSRPPLGPPLRSRALRPWRLAPLRRRPMPAVFVRRACAPRHRPATPARLQPPMTSCPRAAAAASATWSAGEVSHRRSPKPAVPATACWTAMKPSCRRCASRPRRTLAAEGAARRAAAETKHRNRTFLAPFPPRALRPRASAAAHPWRPLPLRRGPNPAVSVRRALAPPHHQTTPARLQPPMTPCPGAAAAAIAP
mmetsp:Transcript_26409/g.76185  ORF Transcript_26409/g.76185 Transcript_26409/m.76185 type:complete len:226 (-) Transcript_26409:98-775(-)